MRKWVLILLVCVAFYTRFVGLDWGLPYPMHPDERNMADAVTQISLKNIYSPSFWAYGGMQINAAHMISVAKNILFIKASSIQFTDAILSLRTLSALFSIATCFFVYKMVYLYTKNKEMAYFSFALSIFSPGLIQASHFGTTESALAFFYSALIYLSSKVLMQKKSHRPTVVAAGVVVGAAVATKASALFFAAPVFFAILLLKNNKKRSKIVYMLHTFGYLLVFGLTALSITILFSPHYILYSKEFIGSLMYERTLVTGGVDVFYTKQFFQSIPVIFQIVNVFPYMLGMLVYISAAIGFFMLPWKNREVNLLRFAFLVFFIPNAFLYTKWARYMTPLVPICIVLAVLLINMLIMRLKTIKNIYTTMLKTSIAVFFFVPGIAYLSIYMSPDVRFVASSWIYANIPANAQLLSETANVIDVPVPSKLSQQVTPYITTIFNFYDLDFDPQLEYELEEKFTNADYVIVPSRRIFANFTCIDPESGYKSKAKGYHNTRCEELQKQYPKLNAYYSRLFSPDSPFKLEKVITSYPKISLFGTTLLEFPDEVAEETWTVFDHPVIRVYKRI